MQYSTKAIFIATLEKNMPYNKATSVNGKEIILTREEKSAVDEFHKSRIAFAFLSDGRCAININDAREHKIYLKDDFSISFEEFEHLTRGYIKPGRLVFYTSLNFLPVKDISEEMVNLLTEKALEFFGPGKYEIWNGLKIGRLGEEWEAIEIKGTVLVR